MARWKNCTEGMVVLRNNTWRANCKLGMLMTRVFRMSNFRIFSIVTKAILTLFVAFMLHETTERTRLERCAR